MFLSGGGDQSRAKKGLNAYYFYICKTYHFDVTPCPLAVQIIHTVIVFQGSVSICCCQVFPAQKAMNAAFKYKRAFRQMPILRRRGVSEHSAGSSDGITEGPLGNGL